MGGGMHGVPSLNFYHVLVRKLIEATGVIAVLQ